MASRFIQHTTRRHCQYQTQRRLTSDSKIIEFASKKSANSASKQSQSSSELAEPTSLLSRITSHASQTAQQSLDKVKQSATSNLHITSQSLKESIVSVAQSSKERIRNESSQYVSSARSSLNNLGQQVKTSTVDNLNNTRNILKESISSAAEKGRERIKHELSSRLSFDKSIKPNAKYVTDKGNEAIQQSISKSTSAANFATKVLTDTTAQAASNMTSTVKESVSKATRWLWWWGLAAVGVYGMSTTLTKEGVQVLKDLVAGGGARSKAVESGAADDRIAKPVETKAVDVSNNEEAAAPSWMSSVKRYFGCGKKE